MSNLTPHALLESLNIKPEEKANTELLWSICSRLMAEGVIYHMAMERNYGSLYLLLTSEAKGQIVVKDYLEKTCLSVLTEIMEWVQPKKGGSE